MILLGRLIRLGGEMGIIQINQQIAQQLHPVDPLPLSDFSGRFNAIVSAKFSGRFTAGN